MEDGPEDAAVPLSDPVLNGPYEPPSRHFVIGAKGPTGEVREGRRPSESFIPVAPVRKTRGRPKAGMPLPEAGEQLTLGLVEERRQDNALINELRRDVANWRDAGYPGTTATSAKLLRHWADSERETASSSPSAKRPRLRSSPPRWPAARPTSATAGLS